MKGQTSIIGAILFFVAAIIFVVYVNGEGFIPETKIGTKQFGILTLKEEGVGALITVDQAIFYSSYKAIIDSSDNGLVYDKKCGYHLNPILAGNGNCYENSYVNYLKDNMNFYLRNFDYDPVYEYEIKSYGNKTNVSAIGKETLKIISRSDVSAVTNTALFTQWPGSTTISSCYGWRTLPNGKQDYTDGIDLAGSFTVKAVAQGKVYSVCDDFTCNTISGTCENKCGDFGANIVIAHEQGYYTRYSHLSRIDVKKDDPVRIGQEIGFSGNTGASYGDHLDFKIYTSQDQLTKKDGAQSPLCFFNDETIQSLTFSGQSCLEKYGSNSIKVNNFPIKLTTECASGLSQAGNIEDIPKSILDRSVQFTQIIDREAEKNNIPSALIKSIFTQESGFQTKVVSATGAAGIAQFTASTGESYGLKTTACCTKEQANAGVCSSIQPPVCSIDNDERFDPSEAIPAAAEYLGELYFRFDQNIFLTAVAYNAGPGVASKMREQPGCEIITEANAIGCARIPTIQEFNADKFENEIKPYLENMKKYYPAWGGTIGQTGVFGSFYEVNPSTKRVVNFDIKEFDKVYDVALQISNCESDSCIQEQVIENSLQESCKELDEFDRFVMSYEQCKHFDWVELNKTNCGCNIEWPAIGQNRKLLFYADKIVLIEDNKIIRQHLTDGVANAYFEGDIKQNNFYYESYSTSDCVNADRTIDYLDEGGDAEDVDYLALVSSCSSKITPEIKIDDKITVYTDIERTESGLVLNNNPRTCTAKPLLRSYCYESNQKILRLVDDKVGSHKILIPFSVKLDN